MSYLITIPTSMRDPKWWNSCDKEIMPKVIATIDDGGRNFLAREFTTTRESL